MSSGYAVPTGADVALVAATAKSVIGVRAGSTFGLKLTKSTIGFKGVTASDVPVLIELCYATFATNAPGTNSTDIATTPGVRQIYGRAVAHGVTAARNWTTEPTVLTVLEELLLTPNGGTIKWAEVLGQEPDCDVSNGFVLRMTAPQAQNVRATLAWERI